ncbi:MAG: hypothetical protein MOB07_09370 [Acidobacteria bacterium]|nr:hypothetical protein [Acidobacteriota bacterium]
MSETQANLNQALRLLEQFGPQELAVIEERLAARKQNSEQPPDAAGVFDLPFDDYLAMSDEARDSIAFRAYQTLGEWIDAELKKRKAEWILVCGGVVIESSPTLRDYPSREKLMKIGQQRGLVPFVFVKAPLIEESGWSTMSGADFYPTIRLTVAAPGTSIAHSPTSGTEFTADFDSGSPNLFVDYDQILASQIIDYQPIDQSHFRSHLGQVYRYHVLPLLIGVRSEDGMVAEREFSALCVRDWSESPLCLVNSDREALAGRNLLIEFPLRLELDGVRKVTRIALD